MQMETGNRTQKTTIQLREYLILFKCWALLYLMLKNNVSLNSLIILLKPFYTKLRVKLLLITTFVERISLIRV